MLSGDRAIMGGREPGREDAESVRVGDGEPRSWSKKEGVGLRAILKSH